MKVTPVLFAVLGFVTILQGEDRPNTVYCANLIYGKDQTAKCFADHFLKEARQQTNIWAHPKFVSVRLESSELMKYPFVIMSGEDAFTLTKSQTQNLRKYLLNGGFLVASAGCSSNAWGRSFEGVIKDLFPDQSLEDMPLSHEIFNTVYEITELKTKKKTARPVLKALTLDKHIVVVYSSEGLNDTASLGGACCCCGGNELLNARYININLLAYALTH